MRGRALNDYLLPNRAPAYAPQAWGAAISVRRWRAIQCCVSRFVLYSLCSKDKALEGLRHW